MSGSYMKPAGGIAAVIVPAMMWPAQVSGYEPPPGIIEYCISHSKYNDIGTYSPPFTRVTPAG